MARRGARGFTLIEMLVVIGIIAVLAAIIIPVYSRAQEKGRQANCIANLHAITVALKMYVQELKAYPPPYDSTTNTGGLAALYDAGYLENFRALRCPDDPNKDDPNLKYSSYNAYYNYWGYKTTNPADPAQIGIPCVPDGDNPATPVVEGPGYSSLDAAQTYTDDSHVGLVNQRNQSLWTYNADETQWGLWARGRTSAFPGLVNQVAGDNVVVTRCPFHRNFFGTNSERDLTAFVGGSTEAVMLRTYDWTTQPIVQ